ncbi:MAG: hypothetical protein HY774_08720 [Acidobacteria bacterium]|nr:hypothetical protein [Acidobacteriota bacterium]
MLSHYMKPFSRAMGDFLEWTLLTVGKNKAAPLFTNEQGKLALSPWLDRAKNIAYAIHPNDELAEGIVGQVLRFFIVLGNRSQTYRNEENSTKALLNDPQSFQMLLYEYLNLTEVFQERYDDPQFACSPPLSKQRHMFQTQLDEPSDDPNREITARKLCLSLNIRDMVLEQRMPQLSLQTMWARYLKFLVFLTADHDVFWSSYTLTQFRHIYEKAELKKMWTKIGYVKNRNEKNLNTDVRKLKAKLLSNLESRFGDFLEPLPETESPGGFKGRETFIQDPEVLKFVAKMNEVLTPWKTSCLEFREKKSHLKLDLGYVHGFICPECFPWLVQESIGSAPPEERLALPTFFGRPPAPYNGDSSNNGRIEMGKEKNWRWWFMPDPPPLDPMFKRLEQDAQRRKVFTGSELGVYLDGYRIGKLPLQESRSIQFSVGAESRFLQIVAEDDRDLLPMAVLALNQSEIKQSVQYKLCGVKTYAIVLEGGQEIRFRTQLEPDLADETSYHIEIEYVPGRPQPLARSVNRHWLFPTVVTAALAILLGLGYFWFLRRQIAGPPEPIVKQPAPVMPPTPLPAPPKQEMMPPGPEPQQVQKPALPNKPKSRPKGQPPVSESQPDVPMHAGYEGAQTLAETQDVFLQITQNGTPIETSLQTAFEKALVINGYHPVPEVTLSDTILFADIKPVAGKGSVEIELRMENLAKTVLWPTRKAVVPAISVEAIQKMLPKKQH